jgi:hypothetical protein
MHMLGFQQKHIQACCSSNLLRQLQLSQIWHTSFYPEAAAEPYSRGHGATAARLTPDQKVGISQMFWTFQQKRICIIS